MFNLLFRLLFQCTIPDNRLGPDYVIGFLWKPPPFLLKHRDPIQSLRAGFLNWQTKPSECHRICLFIFPFYLNFIACFGIWFHLDLVNPCDISWCDTQFGTEGRHCMVRSFLATNALPNGLFTVEKPCDT